MQSIAKPPQHHHKHTHEQTKHSAALRTSRNATQRNARNARNATQRRLPCAHMYDYYQVYSPPLYHTSLRSQKQEDIDVNSQKEITRKDDNRLLVWLVSCLVAVEYRCHDALQDYSLCVELLCFVFSLHTCTTRFDPFSQLIHPIHNTTSYLCIVLGPCNIEYKLNVQNVTCKGGSDGAVNIVISKGAGPFMYLYNHCV